MQMALVNKAAPKFKAGAVINGEEIVENFSLEQFLGKKTVVFFFYPKDFTFVCPTELFAFQEKLKEFEKRNVAVVACSTDTEETHLAWLSTPKDKGGIEGVTYPIVADVSKTISSNFQVLGGEYYNDEDGNLAFSGAPIALRGTFLIDKEGIVRHSTINHFPLTHPSNLDAILILQTFNCQLQLSSPDHKAIVFQYSNIDYSPSHLPSS